jgi:hypothetical protein
VVAIVLATFSKFMADQFCSSDQSLFFADFRLDQRVVQVEYYCANFPFWNKIWNKISLFS